MSRFSATSNKGDGGEKITHVKLVEEVIDGCSITREVLGSHDQESERNNLMQNENVI